jgi:hypothetical protein
MQTLAILLMFVLAAPFQRIETQYHDRGKVTRVETALNHLTIIELAEPVMLAAAGSPLFKIERRDNKVFIQPLEEGASTNLFLWTGSGRWNYELIPAASVETMHFAIDQEIAPPSKRQNTVNPSSAVQDSSVSQSFAEEMLLFAKPVRTLGVTFSPTQVRAFITDVYRKDGQLFIRYVIDNRTSRPYVGSQPEVFELESAHSRISLHALRFTQVGPDIDREIRSRGQTRIATIDCEVPPEPIPPGETVTGILTMPLPLTRSEPAVFRFLFPTDGYEPISLTLVL